MFNDKDFEGTVIFLFIMAYLGFFTILGLIGWGLWTVIKFIF